MQAIILAGGFGTRLKSVTGDIIKPMAPIAGRPFLAWLLDYMAEQGVREVLLCLHHKAEQVTQHFGSAYGGMTLRYLIEERALGTGGALMQAMKMLKPTQPVFAMNGDSLVRLNYRQMLMQHLASGRNITLATAPMPDCRRYSQLHIRDELVHGYELYGDEMAGDISVGFYVLSPDIFSDMYDDQTETIAYKTRQGFAESSLSFERDFLAPNVPHLLPAAFSQVDYFIDIGVPQDYARAQLEVPNLLRQPLAA
ncbi:MAG: sugar phosphate nucleotidyltransferase [Alphaproteobacteria bacterium]|nr:sugar phosphate nucleotidyltransferase [Alphaproteobacteria bacterium]